MKKLTTLGNIEISDKEDYAIFSVNPKIYPLELAYAAAYIMIDKAFIILDGDPKEEILVEIRKKEEKQDIKLLVEEFNEELLNYATYKVQSERSKNIREMILQRVLLTNDPSQFVNTPQINQQQIKEVEIDDPEGIMKTWDKTRDEESENKKKDGKKC